MKQLASQCEGEGQALLARLADLAESAGRWGKPCFSAFLTEHEQAVARRMHPVPGVSFSLEGGHPDAERRVFAAVPDQISLEKIDYPFDALTILMPRGYSVSHRDALGSFMALGVKRETLGDILVGIPLLLFCSASGRSADSRGAASVGRVGVRCAADCRNSFPRRTGWSGSTVLYPRCGSTALWQWPPMSAAPKVHA